MDILDDFQVDWESAITKTSRYLKDPIDWWRVIKTENGRKFEFIGEDTNGDQVVDFIHASTRADGRMEFSAFSKGGKWYDTNLIEALLEINFSLPWARSSYVPYNADIYFNDFKIATFINSLPEGHYAFPIPPGAIFFHENTEADYTIEVKSEHLRGGHYIVTSDFQLLYRLTEVDTYVIAESREAAEKKVLDTPGFRFKGSDLSVNSNDLSISKSVDLSHGERLEISANIHNLGMDPAKEVTVALVQSLPGGANPIEVSKIIVPDVPLYGPTPVKFSWTAVPGEHALKVIIDPDKELEENSRFNNEALITVKVGGKDTPPNLEITSPEDGQKFDQPKIRLEARGIDESGILLMEYRIDGGLWMQRKGADKISEEIIVQPGEHTIYFRATDCSGNPFSSSRKITVDFKQPSATIVAPDEGALIKQNTVVVTINLDNPAEIVNVEARVADGAWKELEFSGENTLSFELAVEVGKQPLEVKLIDRNGIEAMITRTIEVVV